MLFDVNAWLGSFAFRSLRDNTPEALVRRLDREGIRWAAVAPIEAIFHRNVQPANERLVESIAPFADRLLPMAVINPAYVKWEDDLARCHEELGVIGVRLLPVYHGYDIDGPLARRVLGACRERGLPVSIPQRIEDPRQRHPFDPGVEVDLRRVAALLAAEPKATLIVTNARGDLAGSSLATRPDLREAAWCFDLSLALGNHFRQTTDLVERCGPGRLVYGTHLPFSYAACATVKLHLLPVDDEAKADVAYRNAWRLFRLEERLGKEETR